MSQKITPFLWFDSNAEQAMDFYVSVFPDAKILSKQAGPDGVMFTGSMELAGQRFNLLNGGPAHAGFSEAISFMVGCKDQIEVDYFWDKLTADGGAESNCGWLKDKYGLSWQIIPDALMTYLGGADADGRQRATAAMLKMQKIVIADLKAAYEGE
jgi:predicted 3-demethylubiquinone-9 3-methyltransferase (glyoxalase superfamily)